jgi:hypothetical protein
MSRHPTTRTIDPEWSRARLAHLRRRVIKKLRKFRNSGEYAYLLAKDTKRAAEQGKPSPQF